MAKGPSQVYLLRAQQLAQAIDIAAEVRRGSDGDMTDFEAGLKQQALDPAPAFAKVASLRYLEEAFFTYWNESSDAVVTRFWRVIAERGLPFQRRDVARLALARGRITNQVDFETITDQMADDRFSSDEKRRLDALLHAYAERRLK